jgi:hypothetical protein
MSLGVGLAALPRATNNFQSATKYFICHLDRMTVIAGHGFTLIHELAAFYSGNTLTKD